MGITIEEHRVVQFADSVRMLSQQGASLLRGLVDDYPLTGKTGSIDFIGPVSPKKREGRNADTQLQSTPHYRRWFVAETWDFADIIESQDKANMLYDPTGPYTRNAAKGFARLIDDVIIAAAFADVVTGEERGSSVLWSNQTNQIQTEAGTNGLTLAKLRAAKKRNLKNEERGKWWMVISPDQLDNLLGTTEVTSADYAAVKALVQGEVDTFMGFTFLISNRLPTTAGGKRRCLAFTEGAIGFVEQKGMDTRVSERDDKNYNTQIWASTMIGAVRSEETKVLEIQCHEA